MLGPALMNTLGSGSPEVGETYRRGAALAERVGTAEQKFTAVWGLWLHHQMSGQFEAARRCADEVVAIGRELADSTYLLQGHHAAWTTESYMGNHAKALHHADQGIALYEVERHRHGMAMYGDHDAGVCARAHRGYQCWLLGYPDQAVAAVQASLELAETLGHPSSLAFAQTSAAMVQQLRGDPKAALPHAERLVAYSVENELNVWRMNGEILLGWARGALGEAEGLDMMRAALEARAAVGSKLRQVYYLAAYADLLGRGGRVEAGLAAIEQALALLEQSNERRWAPMVHAVHGDLLRGQGDEDAAEHAFELAIAAARRHEALSFELAAALRLAWLWRDRGRYDPARDLLAPIHARFTEGFETRALREAKALLDELS